MSISKVRKGHIKNTTYILNKVNIKRHFIVYDVLVIVEVLTYFFPKDKSIKIIQLLSHAK